MASAKEARDIVSHSGWLSQTPQWFQVSVLQKSQLLHFETGEKLFEAGDPPGGIYGLVSGGLRVTLRPGDQSPVAVHLYVPGTWMGEAAAISGDRRLIGVSTTRDTQAFHLPLAATRDLLNQGLESYRCFARLTYWHAALALGAVSDLLIRNAENRLIAVLLRLSGCRIETPPNWRAVDIDLSQDDLAIMSNVGRTKANTILRKLQSSGHIEIYYRRLTVLAPDALRERLVHNS
ncbi:hypothetical protein MA20_27025 [Bradyrhizobium japonicum]|uniref:Crp/Fnr family transcriptional regulator n=2 Tax=Bradyrhizobium japonicum TaxID=375 RepID=A0A0A3YRY6_BRAJP|nr:hypothetical protein MA20_27025 [Bradyrhizobium japonicum]